jgi:hypothetical protein
VIVVSLATVGVGVGSSTRAGSGVGVTVGRRIVAGVGVSTSASDSTGVAATVGATAIGVIDNAELTVITDDVVSGTIMSDTVGRLESGPTRATWDAIGGGVSGRLERTWGGEEQCASRRMARISSIRLLTTVRDSMVGVY